MKTAIVILVIGASFLSSCGSASAPAVIPGGGGSHLYEMMDEDSTEVKADSVATEKTDK
jgi:hypothetical protein